MNSIDLTIHQTAEYNTWKWNPKSLFFTNIPSLDLDKETEHRKFLTKPKKKKEKENNPMHKQSEQLTLAWNQSRCTDMHTET